MILFVTSFDQQLYDHSGRKLVQSFYDKQTWGSLLCCHENFEQPAKTLDGIRLIGRDITLNKNLLDWDSKYRERCESSNHFWNHRAWQWYRKSVALRVALTSECTDVRWLIWLDCDCEFLSDLAPMVLYALSKGAAVTYLKGQRKWTETGVVIYDLNEGAALFIESVGKIYDSGKFLELERWDDCWIFDHVRTYYPSDMFRDIADPNETDLRVLESSPLGRYLLHKKGSHIREGVR